MRLPLPLINHVLRYRAAAIVVLIAAVLMSGVVLAEREGSMQRATSAPDRRTTQATEPAGGTPGVDADDAGAREAAPVDQAMGGAITKEYAGSITEAPNGTATSVLPLPDADLRVVRTASLELRSKRGSFEDTWGDVQAVARAHDGIVSAATRTGAGDDARRASVTLRVPTARFDAAIEALRGVPRTTVQRLDIASSDVSAEYVDTTSRLRHDRAVAARLTTLLASAEDVGEVLAVQARIDEVQQRIEMSAGRIKFLDQQTSMSTIEVGIITPSAAATTTTPEADSPITAALQDARDLALERVASGIVWFAGVLPLMLLAGVAYLAGRAVVRRRRAAADTAVTTPAAR